jgi:hypothetical protein
MVLESTSPITARREEEVLGEAVCASIEEKLNRASIGRSIISFMLRRSSVYTRSDEV